MAVPNKTIFPAAPAPASPPDTIGLSLDVSGPLRWVLPMKRAYLFILASFVWLIGGAIAISASVDLEDESLPDVLGWTLLIGFSILFLIGTALWSRAKGYHPVLGVILGWLGPLGLLILVFLPDKTLLLESRPMD